QLDLLWLATELRLSTGTKLGFDLRKRLKDAHDKLVQLRDPNLRSHERWLEIYRAILGPGKGKPRAVGDLDEGEDQGTSMIPGPRQTSVWSARSLRIGHAIPSFRR